MFTPKRRDARFSWGRRRRPMLELAGYLGHASVTTTETHYAALAPDEARGAIHTERAFAPGLIPDAG